MNEQEYWAARNSQESFESDRFHQERMNLVIAEQEMVLFKALNPNLSKDGNQWCCLYGENLQEGIAGFGDTPYKAILDFNNKFYKT